MATDRLTPATCAVGMMVVCVDADGVLVAGKSYTIEEIDGIAGGRVYLDGGAMGPWSMRRFVLASPALPAMTPELVAALRRWHATFAVGGALPRIDRALVAAIAACPGLLAPPPPRTTDATFWLGEAA